MLPRESRLTDSETFRAVVRRGRRAGTSRLVVHLLPGNDAEATQVGFVVSKAVGPAVVRNRVKRRLRHLAREVHADLPGSAVLVVRALPASSEASYEELREDLTRCMKRVMS